MSTSRAVPPAGAPSSRDLGRREANRLRIHDSLLDSAERLFADRGYYGVSVREITDDANTRLAAISEHFGGKESLYREVILRRAPLINADRVARLAARTGERSRSRALQQIVDAFSFPLLLRSQESDGWCNYLRLIAQASTTRQEVQILVADQFNPVASVFINELRRLFPEASPTALHDSYLFLLAATMQVFADNLRLNSLTNSGLSSTDFAERYSSLVPFAVGGITRLAQGNARPSK